MDRWTVSFCAKRVQTEPRLFFSRKCATFNKRHPFWSVRNDLQVSACVRAFRASGYVSRLFPFLLDPGPRLSWLVSFHSSTDSSGRPLPFVLSFFFSDSLPQLPVPSPSLPQPPPKPSDPSFHGSIFANFTKTEIQISCVPSVLRLAHADAICHHVNILCLSRPYVTPSMPATRFQALSPSL